MFGMIEFEEFDCISLTHNRVWEVRLSNDELYWLDNKCVVETICDAEHGDWKTAMVRNIPKIPKGTQLEVTKVWQNFYGVWVEVNYGGRHYDISPRQLKYVKRNE